MIGKRQLTEADTMDNRFRCWIRRSFTPGTLYNLPVGLFVYVSFLNVGHIREWIAAHRAVTIAVFVAYFLGISLCITLRKKKTGKSAETAGTAWIDLGILIAALICGMFGLVGIGMAAAGAAVGAVLLVFDYAKGTSPKEADKTE